MPEHIHSFSTVLTDAWGVRYRVRVEGERNQQGTWDGWLVFEPHLGAGPALRTGRETTRPERADLASWASGLDPGYLESAIGRARSD